jgi:hypothetical protein
LLLNNVIIIPLLLSILLNAFSHMRHFYLRLRWNKVVVVSRQNKKIIALVDTVLVAISMGGMIQLDLRQSALPCMASGALIQVCHNFFTLHSVPFTMIARLLLTTLSGLLSKQREEDKHV